MPRTHFLSLGLMLLAMLSCAGGRPGELKVLPGMVVATGVVTFDGQPLETGQVTLISEKASHPEDQDGWVMATISNGKFQVQIPPGRYLVRVQKYRYDSSGREGRPTLPKKYDQKTKLSAEIFASGPNTLSFQLESDSR